MLNVSRLGDRIQSSCCYFSSELMQVSSQCSYPWCLLPQEGRVVQQDKDLVDCRLVRSSTIFHCCCIKLVCEAAMAPGPSTGCSQVSAIQTAQCASGDDCTESRSHAKAWLTAWSREPLAAAAIPRPGPFKACLMQLVIKVYVTFMESSGSTH